MTWELFYLFCFVLGLALSVAAAFTGGHHIHIGHAHVSGPAHLASRVPTGHGLGRFNGFTLTAFLCWFGGVGYLLRSHGRFGLLAVLLLATTGGLAGAGIVSWFLTSVLLRHERPLTAQETATVGVLGRVSGSLTQGVTGEILFTQLGVRRSAPARSDDGSTIPRGTEVVVLRYERGIAYVRRWDDLVVDAAAAAPLNRTHAI